MFCCFDFSHLKTNIPEDFILFDPFFKNSSLQYCSMLTEVLIFKSTFNPLKNEPLNLIFKHYCIKYTYYINLTASLHTADIFSEFNSE